MESKINLTTTHINNIDYDGNTCLSSNDCKNKTQYIEDSGSFGRYSLNETSLNGILISNWESLFNQDFKLAESISESILSMHFILEGEVIAHFKNLDSLSCKKRQNNLWSFAQGDIGYINFPKNELHKSMNISLNSEYLERLSNNHPDLLSELYNHHLKDKSFCLQKENLQTSYEQNFVITQIKNAELMGDCSDIYKESKILELIALQLHRFQQGKNKLNKHYSCCIQDIDKIHEAKNILITNINHPPTIIELSKRVGINDNKLKKGFKEIFNQTIYGCLYNYKMDLARRFLLDTNKSIFEIALKCGYEYSSHFTTAFKRRYGLTPIQFRKKF